MPNADKYFPVALEWNIPFDVDTFEFFELGVLNGINTILFFISVVIYIYNIFTLIIAPNKTTLFYQNQTPDLSCYY